MDSTKTSLCYQSFISDMFHAVGVDESIYQLFTFLRKFIPAHSIFCYTINRKEKILNTIIHYSANAAGNCPYSTHISKIFSWDELQSKMQDKENYITITNDVSENHDTWEYIKNYQQPFRSCLLMYLHWDEQADSLCAVMLVSLEPDQYSGGHAELLAAFRRPLENLIKRFFLSSSEPYLRLTDEGPAYTTPEGLLRRCKGLGKVMRQVDAVAMHNTTVLIHGASGSGKELVAESIHALSSRREAPLIKVNCGAIPESLLDSELFGHEKGAFTGASATRPGYFEQARDGTIYLDEIGELAPSAQVRLLRVLESKEIRRVGGTRRIPVDVRVIAATHRDLWAMVQDGRFREDLWYRLHAFPIDVPSLAWRVEDIPILVEHFYNHYVRELKLSEAPRLTRQTVQDLTARPWPGNIRELRHVIERALIMSVAEGARELQLAGEDKISPGADGFPQGSAPAKGRKKREARDPALAAYIREALAASNGRIQGTRGAAARLGVSPSTLRSRMKALGIPLPRAGRSA